MIWTNLEPDVVYVPTIPFLIDSREQNPGISLFSRGWVIWCRHGLGRSNSGHSCEPEVQYRVRLSLL